MSKKTELASKQNSRNLARIGLIALFSLIIQWQSFAVQNNLSSVDTVVASPDSSGFIYHKAWSFEEGYEERYLSRDAYQYEEVPEQDNWWRRLKLWFERTWYSLLDKVFGGENMSGFWRAFFQIAPYLALLALMVLLVWLVMKFSSENNPEAKEYFSGLSSDEVLIKNSDLKKLAEEALKVQDFRLALRYRYLLVLRNLIDRNLILWKSSKTNFDYQKELRESTFLDPFKEVTRIYNFVWYGQQDLDAKTYSEFEQAFNHIDHLS